MSRINPLPQKRTVVLSETIENDSQVPCRPLHDETTTTTTTTLVSPQPPPSQLSSRRPPCNASNRNGLLCLPQCLVKLPVTNDPEDHVGGGWWPCLYLPNHSMILQLHEMLYKERHQREPNNPELEQERKSLETQCLADLYFHCNDVLLPVWLLMGRTSRIYPCEEFNKNHHTLPYLSSHDQDFLPKWLQLMAQSETNPLLQRALEEFAEYRKWTQQHIQEPNYRTCQEEPCVPETITLATPEPWGSATAIVSGEKDEEQDAPPSNNMDTTVMSAARKRPIETVESSLRGTARKCNHRALKEAQRGPQDTSPYSSHCQIRLEIFPAPPLSLAQEIQESKETEPPVQEDQEVSSEPVKDMEVSRATATETHEPSAAMPFSSTREAHEPPTATTTEPESLRPVDLPGRTVREKLQSCLEALRKESESLVVCRKILECQRQIFNFFNDVIRSRGTHAGRPDRHDHQQPTTTAPPIMYVCGAPGSGKTMTVEQCGRVAIEQFGASHKDCQAPPKVVYLHCSAMQFMSTDMAWRYTLASAEVTECDLKKSVVVFVLDEIDFLVSTRGYGHHKSNRLEQYLQKLVELAKSKSNLVGLVGISNSVENKKAKRLEFLGFRRENQIVFKTYDRNDLTYIASSRIGSTVVDTHTMDFLSANVANSSGDARRHLDILSRTLLHLMENMTEEALNAEHQGPIVKISHIQKMLRQSIIPMKDLLQESPSLDKHVLCFCMQLVGYEGSRKWPLQTLLGLLRQCYSAVEIEGPSQLSSALERLVDNGLLKLKRIGWDEICFGDQLAEAESAVRDILMSKQFYMGMATRLAKEMGTKLHGN